MEMEGLDQLIKVAIETFNCMTGAIEISMHVESWTADELPYF